MKKIIFVPLLMLLLLCTGCTQNNGDIGDLFGFWRLTEEGNTSLGDDEIVWAFQNNILEITVNTPHHVGTKTYGTYTDNNDALRIDFTHWKGLDEGAHLYMMPALLDLPGDEPFVMQVIKRGAESMTLQYEGRTFKLKKVF